ncbi:unnamed protein product [Echinostoma caproni]|uniref:RWD domain-containing protein n=1 Tax=Echinostoma caproni TaxID=27848 RepID=A0A183BAQ5_9TREM|nr:unnamed protein product [Echinostoma caproni]
MSLDSRERIEVTEAFTIADFPMRDIESITELETRWPHLRDLHFEGADSLKVELHIEGDVPEAHWVLSQRLGSMEEPYAALAVFGWTLFGPPYSANSKPLSINFTITAGDDTIEQILQRIYENEFNELSDQKGGPLVEDNQALAIVETGTLLARQVRGAITMEYGIWSIAEQRDSPKMVAVP